MVKASAASLMYGLIRAVPRAVWSLALAVCVFVTPVSALAQSSNDAQTGTEKPCYRLLSRDEGRVFVAFNPYCDLRVLTRTFPLVNPETGKPFPTQVQLRSLYAANQDRMVDGRKVRRTVMRGCVRPGKPSGDADQEELEYCANGLVNYFAAPADDSEARIIVTTAQNLTYAQKLEKKVDELTKEVAKLKSGKPAEQPATAAPSAPVPSAETDKALADVRAQNAALQAKIDGRNNWLLALVLLSGALAAYAVWSTLKLRRANKDLEAGGLKGVERYEALKARLLKGSEAELAALESRLAASEKAARQAHLDCERIQAESQGRQTEIERLNQQSLAAEKQLNDALKETKDAKRQMNDAKAVTGKLVSDLDAARDEVGPLKTEIETLKKANAELTGRMQGVENVDVDRLATAKENAEKDAAAQGRELSAANAKVLELQGKITDLEEERNKARGGNQDLRGELEGFRRNVTELQGQLSAALAEAAGYKAALDQRVAVPSNTDEHERTVANLGDRIRDLEENLAAERRRGSELEQQVSDLKSVSGEQPKTAEQGSVRKTTLLGLVPPTVPKSTVTNDVDPQAGSDTANEQFSAATDKRVLEALRAHLMAMGQAEERRNGALSRVNHLRGLAQAASEAVDRSADYPNNATAECQTRLEELNQQLAVAQEELDGSHTNLKDLERQGAGLGFEPFALKGQPFDEKALAKAFGDSLRAALQEFKDALQPMFNALPKWDQKAAEERRVLHQAAKDACVSLGADGDCLDGQSVEELATSLRLRASESKDRLINIAVLLGDDEVAIQKKTPQEIEVRLRNRAMVTMGKASSESTNFATATDRIKQLEGMLAEERKNAADAHARAIEAENAGAKQAEEASILKDAADRAQHRLAMIQNSYDRMIDEARKCHEEIKIKGQDKRMALLEMRTLVAEKRSSDLMDQADRESQENEALRNALAKFEGMFGKTTGEPAVFVEDEAMQQAFAQGMRNLRQATDNAWSGWRAQSSKKNGGAASATDDEISSLRPPPTPDTGNWSLTLEQRLDRSQWGEVQSVTKRLIRQIALRIARGDKIVYLAETTDDLYALHALLHLPLEYGREVDRRHIVRVAEGQCIFHAMDKICGKPADEGSVSVVRKAETLRPVERFRQVPGELQDLLPAQSRKA